VEVSVDFIARDMGVRRILQSIASEIKTAQAQATRAMPKGRAATPLRQIVSEAFAVMKEFEQRRKAAVREAMPARGRMETAISTARNQFQAVLKDVSALTKMVKFPAAKGPRAEIGKLLLPFSEAIDRVSVAFATLEQQMPKTFEQMRKGKGTTEALQMPLRKMLELVSRIQASLIAKGIVPHEVAPQLTSLRERALKMVEALEKTEATSFEYHQVLKKLGISEAAVEAAVKKATSAKVKKVAMTRKEKEVINSAIQQLRAYLTTEIKVGSAERDEAVRILNLINKRTRYATKVKLLEQALKLSAVAIERERMAMRKAEENQKRMVQVRAQQIRVLKDFASRMGGFIRSVTGVDLTPMFKGVGAALGGVFGRISKGQGRLAGFARTLGAIGGKVLPFLSAGLGAASTAFATMKNAIQLPIRYFRILWWTGFRLIYTFNRLAMVIERFVGPPLKAIYTLTRAMVMTGGSIRNLSKMIIATTRATLRFGISLDQSTSMMLEAAKVGYSAAGALKIFNAAMQLGAAWGGEYSEAMKLTVGALKTFGLGVEEATSVTQKFFAVTSKTLANLHYLETAWGYAAPAAASFGAEIDDVATLIGFFADRSIRASRAGMGIRALFQGLQQAAAAQSRETMNMNQALDILGVNFEKLTKEGVSLKDIWESLHPLAERLNDVQVKQALRLIFTARHYNKVIMLIRAEREEIERRMRQVQAQADLEAKATKIAASGYAVWERLKNIWLIIRVHAMEPLATVFAKISKAINRSEKYFRAFGRTLGLALMPLAEFFTKAIEFLISQETLGQAVKVLAEVGTMAVRVFSFLIKAFFGAGKGAKVLRQLFLNLVKLGLIVALRLLQQLPYILPAILELGIGLCGLLVTAAKHMKQIRWYINNMLRLGKAILDFISVNLAPALVTLIGIVWSLTQSLQVLARVARVAIAVGTLGMSELFGNWDADLPKELKATETALRDLGKAAESFSRGVTGMEKTAEIRELTETIRSVKESPKGLAGEISESLKGFGAQLVEAFSGTFREGINKVIEDLKQGVPE